MRFLYILLLLSTFVYGFVTERPFHILKNLLKLENAPSNIEDFNAVNDEQEDSYGRVIHNIGDKVQIEKKLDFKPKYDPGWKFIGLGKRPRQNEIGYGYVNPFNPVSPNDNGFLNDNSYQDEDGRINPFLTISSIINFEIFNAIRKGIDEDIKKEDAVKTSQFNTGLKSSHNRFSGQSTYSGKKSAMYDPGWMLTGLGK